MKKVKRLVVVISNATKFLVINCSLLIWLSGCSVGKRIEKQANREIISDSILASAHVGISLYDATDNKYLYNYQGDKYFIPASNTKIFTCYAAMKYLGDSLVGLRYQRIRGSNDVKIIATGDPTLLHPDFKIHPVLNFLKNSGRFIYLTTENWQDNALGEGWSWDDYNDDYMVERSAMPIYGNVAQFHIANISNQRPFFEIPHYAFQSIPSLFEKNIHISSKADSFRIMIDGIKAVYSPELISLKRRWNDNTFLIVPSKTKFAGITVPFSTIDKNLVADLLQDTIHKEIGITLPILYGIEYLPEQSIHSQPTDSLLKIMMHRSDNFYAEQSLLMVSNEKLGVMNDKKIIDTLLSTDLKDLPQHPQWVDGSGLSRYNLFSPQDFVFTLNKMRSEFSWNRITTIFSTGGDGTLGNYYKGLKGKIFAKTGSLSNNIALSGYIITKKNKTLVFSVLVGNFMASSSAVRKAVERFLTAVQQEY